MDFSGQDLAGAVIPGIDLTGANLEGAILAGALLVGADGDFAAILGPSGEIDSLLVVAWGAVTRDVYQQTMHPDLAGETLTGLSRRVTLVLALVALAVARLAPGRCHLLVRHLRVVGDCRHLLSRHLAVAGLAPLQRPGRPRLDDDRARGRPGLQVRAAARVRLGTVGGVCRGAHAGVRCGVSRRRHRDVGGLAAGGQNGVRPVQKTGNRRQEET